MIKKVIIYPNRSRISETDISSVEQKLTSLNIGSVRFDDGELPCGADAMIVLGGDGTMLQAAHTAIEIGLPVLGINFGTLGYMSGLESGELDMLAALTGSPDIEERMLIDISVQRGGKVIASYTALNEAVITRYPQAGIADMELMCDGATVCAYRADGVIAATPTGSSAYALSAGAPIIDTKLDALEVSPICPHTLGSRTMIFSPNSTLTIINNSADKANAVTADGHYIADLNNGDVTEITRSNKTLSIIKIKKDAFYDILYRKMK